MRADKQTSYFNTYSYNHSSKMKCKRVGKKNANTNNTLMCYRRGNRRTRQKTSPPPSKYSRLSAFPRFSSSLSRPRTRFMFLLNSGIFVIFEHQWRLSCIRHSISNLLGRLVRFLHPCKLRIVSFLWIPTDGWTLRKFIQSLRTKLSRFGISMMFGASISFRDPLSSMNFKFSKLCLKPKKKKKKKRSKTISFCKQTYYKKKSSIRVPKLPLIGNLMSTVLKGTLSNQELLSY